MSLYMYGVILNFNNLNIIYYNKNKYKKNNSYYYHSYFQFLYWNLNIIEFLKYQHLSFQGS